MVTTKDFEIGDLVWARMKCFPFWPAKIMKPPTAKSTTPKKSQHYVYFFGSENYAWILDENIVHHSEEMLKSTKKKKSASYKLAIEQIIEESASTPKKAKSPVKEKESTKKSPEVSTSSVERKNIKVQKSELKTETPKVQKKTALKRRISDDSANKRASPPRKLPKKIDDYSALFSNTPPNIGYNRVAIIKPLEERANSLSSGFTRRDYFELPPVSSLDLRKINEVFKEKKVKATEKKIGFIGLGMMGQRIAKNLIITGHKVTIWNRTPEKCTDFLSIGASSAQTPGDVVEKCDLIFCCVSDSDAAKSLVFGNCGILSGLEKASKGSKGYIELTTIDPVTSLEIAEAISHKGGRYLEAQIQGSRQLAEEGNLLVLGAGDRDLFTSCESCFYVVARHAYYLSCDVGSGCKMNLILSMLVGISHAALAEAMALVERCNLAQANFLEILELGTLKSPLLLQKGHAMHQRYFVTDSSLKYQQKDLNLALSLGNMYDQPLFLTSAANNLFKHAKLLRYSEHDVSAVYLGAKY